MMKCPSSRNWRPLSCLAMIAFVFHAPCNAIGPQQIVPANVPLKVNIDTTGAYYSISAAGLATPVLHAQFAVEANHRWINSRDYPKHTVSQSEAADDLGVAHQWIVQCSGLPNQPDLKLILRSYPAMPFADVQVIVANRTRSVFEIQAIRSVSAEGNGTLNLGAEASLDTVLSESLSENRPELHVLGSPEARNAIQRGAGSQLIYNRQSHWSVFFGALTSDRFLSILRLRAVTAKDGATEVMSYQVDSTGTTEMLQQSALVDAPSSSLLDSSTEDQVELSLPLKPGTELASERILIGLGDDYHRQLELYGALIKQLHHPRLSAVTTTPMGWWSWTAYYFGLNQGTALTNAEWLSQHLKSAGYDFFFIDEGYQYARGEYITANPELFPDGLRVLEQKVAAKGLTPGIWTAPFEVSARSWVYEHHQDWLVHNAKGQPIHCGWVLHGKDPLFSLDPTNPGAQDYLRKTYSTLVDRWGIRYIKMDFLVDNAIEGFYYRPNTTALEAQRIGLGVIRETVGDKVLLDKDGGESLNPVGLVDLGRISNDTGHTFYATKVAASGIAGRYFMNENFFLSDPDAFTVSTQHVNDPDPDPESEDGVRPLTLNEAEVSIATAAVSGGMFEIGDDLPTLGADPDRMALVENRELIRMAQFRHASVPLDLMSYATEDEQPSVFLLKEDARTSILTVFNWTENSRKHEFDLPSLVGGSSQYQITNILDPQLSNPTANGALVVDQPARSVRMLKIVDASVPPVAIKLKLDCPADGDAGKALEFSAREQDQAEPIITYEWEFGDGVTSRGSTVSHAYTHSGEFIVKLRAEGVTGIAEVRTVTVSIKGKVDTRFLPPQARGVRTPE